GATVVADVDLERVVRAALDAEPDLVRVPVAADGQRLARDRGADAVLRLRGNRGGRADREHEEREQAGAGYPGEGVQGGPLSTPARAVVRGEYAARGGGGSGAM